MNKSTPTGTQSTSCKFQAVSVYWLILLSFLTGFAWGAILMAIDHWHGWFGLLN